MENQNQSENINELVKALSLAQSNINGAKKDSTNPFFNSDYAGLSSIWNACRVSLSDNGLAVMQTVEGTKESPTLITTLAHESGQWIKSHFPIYLNKLDSQSVGSAITYSRRYALAAIVGVCPEGDDDGEASMGLSDKEKNILREKFKGEPSLEKKSMKKFGIDDVTKMSRGEYNYTIEFFKNKEKNKNKSIIKIDEVEKKLYVS